MLIKGMLLAILTLFMFVVLCVMTFIAIRVPIEIIKQLKEMKTNGKNKG